MIIIPGGMNFFGRRFDDFVVGDEHSVFGWCKIYIRTRTRSGRSS
jgi:hypothetical protein